MCMHVHVGAGRIRKAKLLSGDIDVILKVL